MRIHSGMDFHISVDIAAAPETVWAVIANHSVEPILSGTRVTLRLHYAGAIGRLLARLTRGITGRYLGFEADGLKRRCESLAHA